MTMMRKTSWSMLRVRLIRGIPSKRRLFMKGMVGVEAEDGIWLEVETRRSKYANVTFGKL